VYSGDLMHPRLALWAVGVVAAFAVMAMVLLLLLPAPHTRGHYLAAGTVPTGILLLIAKVRLERERARPRGLAVRHITPERRT
jgi:hypothetical protein